MMGIFKVLSFCEFRALFPLGCRGDNETPLFRLFPPLFPPIMLRLKENRLFIPRQSLALINKHRFEIQIFSSFRYALWLELRVSSNDSIWKNN
jgi:hypothetical protein